MTTMEARSTKQTPADNALEDKSLLEPRYVDDPYVEEELEPLLDSEILPELEPDQKEIDKEEEADRKAPELTADFVQPSTTLVTNMVDEEVDEGWTDPKSKKPVARSSSKPVEPKIKPAILPQDPIGPPPSPAIKAYQAQVSQWSDQPSPQKSKRDPRPKPTSRPRYARPAAVVAPIQMHKLAPKVRPSPPPETRPSERAATPPGTDAPPKSSPAASPTAPIEIRPERDLPPFMQTKYQPAPRAKSPPIEAANSSRTGTRPTRIQLTPTELTEPAVQTAPSTSSPAALNPIDLEQVIASHQPLPKGSIILGVGQDGRPLLLEFSDPSTGGILILGEDAQHNRRHLQFVLASARLLNRADQIEIHVITAEAGQFARASTGLQIIRPEHSGTFELLGNLFEIAERRLQVHPSASQKLLGTLEQLKRKILNQVAPDETRASGPVHILAIDQIDQLISQMEPESLSFLRWLLRKGPEANIWTVATLSSQCSDLDWKTLRSFGLQLVGQIEHPHAAAKMSRIPAAVQRSLSPGKEACLELDGEFIRFAIPEFRPT